MNPPYKKLLFPIIATWVGATASFLIAEAFFRIMAPQSSRSYTFDEHIGYRREPGTFIKNTNGNVIKKHANSMGFVDDEWDKLKPSHTYRIGVFGDSMTEALQVNDNEDFESSLEKLFREKEKSVEVLNFGLSGQSTAQEYLTFETYGKLFDLDLVVLVVAITNDVSENSKALRKISYAPYITFDPQNRTNVVPAKDPTRNILIDWIRKHSHTARWTIEKWSELKTQFQNPTTEDAEGNPYVTNEIPNFFANFLPNEPLWDDAWETTDRIIAEFKKSANNSGADFLVVLIPDQVQVREEVWQETLKKAEDNFPVIRKRFGEFDTRIPTDRFNAIFTKHDVRYIDMLPLFKIAASQGKTIYTVNDVHLNPYGHQLTGEAIRSFIDEHFLTESSQ